LSNQGGINIEGRLNYICKNISIKNNSLEFNYHRGTVIRWCEEVDFYNNLLLDSNNSGLEIQNSTNVTIAFNTINRTRLYGIYTDNQIKGNITINNNSFQRMNI